MFGLFDGVAKSVENAIDVGVGVLTLGEYGNLDKKSISKLIADGIEMAVIAEALDISQDVLERILDED